MAIEARKIYRIKLSGERVWVESLEQDGSVMAKRQVHTKLNGDVYITERWHPDELQTEEDFRQNQAKEGQALAEILKANGVVVLDTSSKPDFDRDPTAN